MRNKIVIKLKIDIKYNPQNKYNTVLIVVDLEVLEILNSWRHMCGAILFPNIRSTWRNGKESIRGKRLAVADLGEGPRGPLILGKKKKK